MKKLIADDMHDHSEPGMGKRKLGLDSAMGTVCPVKGCFYSTGVTCSPCLVHRRKSNVEKSEVKNTLRFIRVLMRGLQDLLSEKPYLLLSVLEICTVQRMF